MILPIHVYGQPVLRKMAEDITPEYPNLKEPIADMFETMVHADGVRLAAPQVGLSIRTVTITLDPLSEDYLEFKDFNKTYINPHIVEAGGGEASMEGGCLSLPGIYESVEGGGKVRVKYMDENFVEHDRVVEDYLAGMMQHEFDYLDGKMFIDHLPPLHKQMIRGELSTMLKGKARSSYKMKQME